MNEAVCSGNSHEAPQENCGCGFHAWNLFHAPVAERAGIYGRLHGWGRVMNADVDAWRAQFAEIVALAVVTTWGPVGAEGSYLRGVREPNPQGADLASRYGVPLVGAQELVDAGGSSATCGMSLLPS